MRVLFKLVVLFLVSFVLANASNKKPKAKYEDVGIEILYKNKTKSPKSTSVETPIRKTDPKKEDIDEDKLYQFVFNELKELYMDERNIYKVIGDGSSFVIFNCTQPSYLNRQHELIKLKNHVINDEIQRQSHPMNKLGPGYLCNRTTQVWSISKSEGFEEGGYVIFDDKNKNQADFNFQVLTEESYLRDYFNSAKTYKESLTDKQIDKLLSDIFYLTHHPTHYKQDKTKQSAEIDSNSKKGEDISEALKSIREQQAKSLTDKITRLEKNFTFVKDKNFQRDYIGDGFTSILFNCEDPMYLFPRENYDDKKLDIKQPSGLFIIAVREIGACNKSENVWRRKEKLKNEPFRSYLTIDAKSLDIGLSPTANFLFKLNEKKSLCDEYLKYFNHPYYWITNSKAGLFSKPIECSSRAKHRN